jgi:Peptidase family M23
MLERLLLGGTMRLNGLAYIAAAFLIASTCSNLLAQTAQLPVGPRPISAGFFDASYPQTEKRQHLGTDFTAPAGTTVFSPISGMIVINRTDATDVMEAYVVIRAQNGVEHVLGHITSPYNVGATVEAGQQIGTIRQWPGQPGRSHVHWGINRLGIMQAMTGGWGWGRAPISATRGQAIARGWIDAGNASSSANRKPQPPQNVMPALSGGACSHLVSEAELAVIGRTSTLPPEFNVLTLDSRNILRWNKATIDGVALQQYLDATTRLPRRPFLIFKVESGSDGRIAAQTKRIITRSEFCTPAS